MLYFFWIVPYQLVTKEELMNKKVDGPVLEEGPNQEVVQAELEGFDKTLVIVEEKIAEAEIELQKFLGAVPLTKS
ncbi:hypothetical protein IPJ70_02580 [Candidatus Campbellbacteria bacterium]|nr:MAG: hypothetical protein IPJ70_02580 [Candidatus Campbellbacteria bacterium]